LRLVGADLKANEMIGRIAKINLMLAQVQAPTATPKPAATNTPASVAASNAALTLTGAVEKTVALTMDALKAMTIVKLKAEHPKQGMQEYEGVRLIGLLDMARVKENATKLVMTSADGFVSEVALADVKKCADCLLAFRAGKLDAVMPGMQSNFWAKDVVKIEAK
jgi:hypothetical protein